MQVRKRNGKVVPFDDGYINRAITLAAIAAGEFGKVGESKVAAVTASVTKDIQSRNEDPVFIETIQDTVEDELFKHGMNYTMRAYIRYRIAKEKERERGGSEWKEGLLTKEFLSKYKHSPNPMSQLGTFVYTRT